MRLIQLILVTVTILGLTACGSEVDNTIQPVALNTIHQQLTLQPSWQAQVGSGTDGQYLRLTPAISGKKIFAASYEGQIVALDRHKGDVKWHKQLPHKITSGLTTGANNIYVGTQEGELYALSQKDGHIIWHHTVANAVLAQPAYAHQQVFAKSLDGTIAAFSAKSGHRQWHYQTNVPVIRLYAAGQPRVEGKRVIVGFASGQLMAFNRHSGDLLWQQQVAYPQGSNPVQQMVDITVAPQVKDHHVFVASYQGKAAALNLKTGQPLWGHKLSAYAGIAQGGNNLYVVDGQGHVWSLDDDNGMVNWHNTQLQGRQLSAPKLADGYLFVGDLDGYLHVLNGQTGNIVSRIHAVDSPIIAKPLLKDHTVYLYSKNGQLKAVKLP